jgi:DNA-binding MarR family transcriptional regulator
MPANRNRGLTPVELDAWRAFLRAHARVTHLLDAELTAECELPLGSYEVLLHLNDAPDRRLRMTELADRVLISRSGLTRLVDRLERDGLISRQSCPSDLGRERLRAAAPVHLRGVREHVVGLLDADELATLGELLGRIAGPLDPCGNDDGRCGG